MMTFINNGIDHGSNLSLSRVVICVAQVQVRERILIGYAPLTSIFDFIF